MKMFTKLFGRISTLFFQPRPPPPPTPQPLLLIIITMSNPPSAIIPTPPIIQDSRVFRFFFLFCVLSFFFFFCKNFVFIFNDAIYIFLIYYYEKKIANSKKIKNKELLYINLVNITRFNFWQKRSCMSLSISMENYKCTISLFKDNYF